MAIEDNNANLELAINFNSDVLDKTANGRDGTITGMTYDTTTPIIGSGTGKLRGGDDDVEADVAGAKSGILDLTVGTLWFTFRLPILTTVVRLFGVGDTSASFPNADSFIVQFRGDSNKQMQVSCQNAGNTILNAFTPTNTITDTVKHSMAVRADGSGDIEIAVDDTWLFLTGTKGEKFFGHAVDADVLHIGAIMRGVISAVGDKDIDTVYVFNNAVSDADITDLENGGNYKELLEGIDTTTVGVATAIDGGSRNINVSMPYTDDDNTNSTYTVDYKLSADSTYTNWVTASPNTPSPYTDTITGLVNAGKYDVQVTYNDADGVTGTNPQTIIDISLSATPNKFIPTTTRNDFIYRVVKNTSVVKVVKKTHISKVVK